jgi:tetratricopeptide (TPR) repeat protein
METNVARQPFEVIRLLPASFPRWSFFISPGSAVNRALALNPSLPEVHLALGYYRYYVERDFTGALAELRQAEQALPNDTDVVKTIAFIQRRQGQWDEALAGLRRTVELDPRDIEGYSNLALTYEALRRFPEALATFDRASNWEPANFDCNCAWKTLGRMRADALLSMGNFQDFRSSGQGSVYSVAFIRAGQALLQARYADAKDILSKALADESMSRNQNGPALDEWEILLLPLGLAQQRSGDIAAARATYQQVVRDARHALETVSPGSRGETEAHANLGWAYAAHGEPESAIAEGRKAMTLIPSTESTRYWATPTMPFLSSIDCFAYPTWRHSLRRNCASIPHSSKSGTIRGFKNWSRKKCPELERASLGCPLAM